MTDKEKKEFLSEVLEENGWISTHSCCINGKDQVLSDYNRWSKEGVLISIVTNEKIRDQNVNIYINRWCISSLPIREYEIYSDHLEFMSFGVDVMVRFSDAYVLMEYEPKEIEE